MIKSLIYPLESRLLVYILTNIIDSWVIWMGWILGLDTGLDLGLGSWLL